MTWTGFSKSLAISILIFSLSLTACAGRRGGSGSSSEAEKEGTDRARSVDLPGQDRVLPSEDPRNRALPGQTTIILPEPESIGPAEGPADPFQSPTVPAGEKRYRVQVLATVRVDKALQLRDRLAEMTEEEAFIDREQGIYKVRVGDLDSKETAQTLRRRLVGLGYDDAFVLEFVGR